MANENETVVLGQQILDALRAITKEAKEVEKTEGLDFRFVGQEENIDEKAVKNRITQLTNNLKQYGIKVVFYEDLDIKDTSKGHKYFFRIWDENNNFIEIDTLEYRNVTLDYGHKEIDYIADKLFEMLGLKEYDKMLKISKIIVKLISYVYYFEEYQCKIYDDIGWDKYNGEIIFKYDKIYTQSKTVVRSHSTNSISPELFCGDDSLWDEWKEYAIRLMDESVEARIVLASACTGLVRSLLTYNKETNINMNIQGKAGSGKSSLCQFALSIFGNPSALEGSFIDTDNAMEIIRVKRPVIPYILDDRLLKIENTSEKRKTKELLFDVFREYEGKATERLGGAYKDVSGQRTNAPIISSSVESMLDVLLGSGSDLGQYRRFIEIKLDKKNIFSNDSMVVEKYHELAYQNYGLGVQHIVRYILDLGEDKISDLYEQNFEYISTKLEEKSKKIGMSGLSASASRFSLIATTYMIMERAFNREEVKTEGTVEFDKKIPKEDVMSYDDYYNMLSEIVVDTILDTDLMIETVWKSRDKQYEELVDYLIDNLVEKMERVRLNVYENIVKFISNTANDKWFSKEKPTNFYDTKTKKYLGHIGTIEMDNDIVTITYRTGKHLEELLCTERTLSDKQIKEYLDAVYEDDEKKVKELADELFEKRVLNMNLRKEVKKYRGLQYEVKESMGGKARKVAVLKIDMSEKDVNWEDE